MILHPHIIHIIHAILNYIHFFNIKTIMFSAEYNPKWSICHKTQPSLIQSINLSI